MKKYILFLFAVLFTVTVSKGQSKEELEIRQLEKDWSEWLDKSDTTALLKVWSKDYIVNNPSGKIITGNDIVGFIRNGQRFPAYERVIEKITISQNIAIVMGKEISQLQKSSDGTELRIVRRFTNVWQQTDGKWQLLARQATNVPKQ